MPPDPAAVAASFNECVNSRDLPRLTALMTDDHRFVDAASNTVAGKEACADAWRGFFALFPDYRNVFRTFTTRGDVVLIVGHSECSDAALAGPALWKATIAGGLVAEWHVQDDTPEVRERLGLPPA